MVAEPVFLPNKLSTQSINMSNEQQIIESNLNKDYEYGFVTDIESETIPPGLNEGVIKTISKKKEEPQWLLDWRLKAYRHWLKKEEPKWANIGYPDIDYQSISYFSEPKKKTLASLDEVDPKLLETYNKLGIPLEEQKMLSAPYPKRKTSLNGFWTGD